MYVPLPIDTSHIALNEEHQRLVEKLAANTHDVWAHKRISDGWTYGAERNDIAKTHPCLIPYKDLPETEKAYDREVVTQLIKALIALGKQL